MSDNQPDQSTSTLRDNLTLLLKALIGVTLLASITTAVYFYIQNSGLEQSLEIQGQQLTAALKKNSDSGASTKLTANELALCKQTNESAVSEIEKLKSEVAAFAKQAVACVSYKKRN